MSGRARALRSPGPEPVAGFKKRDLHPGAPEGHGRRKSGHSRADNDDRSPDGRALDERGKQGRGKQGRDSRTASDHGGAPGSADNVLRYGLPTSCARTSLGDDRPGRITDPAGLHPFRGETGSGTIVREVGSARKDR